MRTVLVLLSFIIFFTATLPLLLIFYVIRIFDTKLAARLAQPVVAYGFRFIMWFAGGKPVVEGVEQIPRDTPVLFAGNHRSYFDIVLAYWAIPCTKLTSFIAKKELGYVPMLNLWMILLHCKFLNREDPRKGLKTIQDSIADTKAGWSMFIMPEGTRNQTSEMLPFKSGSLKIAERTGCPIVPVAVTGTDDMYEKHTPWVHGGKIRIRFGAPIPTEGLDREGKRMLSDTVKASIQSMLDGMQEE